jgi:hypothetical protein
LKVGIIKRQHSLENFEKTRKTKELELKNRLVLQQRSLIKELQEKVD